MHFQGKGPIETKQRVKKKELTEQNSEITMKYVDYNEYLFVFFFR